jgi:8-oxo-dGTP pyrophosphatase MutT (NUDIX family)
MELLDIYDDNGKRTGRTVERGDKTAEFNENEHIAVAVIFIENDNYEFLMQKTSKEKGEYFSSTGGHVDSGETPLEAIQREVAEELGIKINKEEIEDYGFLCYDRPIRFLYYIKKNIEPKDIKVDPKEVKYAKYMSIEEIKNLIKTQQILTSHGVLFQELMKKRVNVK